MKEHPGTCYYCDETFDDAEITAHIAQCDGRPSGRARAAHILVESAQWLNFWLHIECAETATFHELDQLLRHVWLECCGHLSAFETNGVTLSEQKMDWVPQWRSSRTAVAKVLEPGDTFDYEYDFGSTTYLRGRFVGWLEKTKRPNPVRLAARNAPVELTCSLCDAEAVHLCSFCGNAQLCDDCVPRHLEDTGCERIGLLPVMNSPRMGVCAYGAA